MIQQNINQAISLAGFLFTQTPAYKQMGRHQELQKQLDVAIQAGEKMVEGEADPEAVLRQGERVKKIREEVFQNKPTTESYAALQKSEEAVSKQKNVVREYQWEQGRKEAEEAAHQEMIDYYESHPEEIPRNQADESVAKKQEEKRETMRRKKGYQSPSVRPFAEMGRKKKRKITTQLEKQAKEEKRNG